MIDTDVTCVTHNFEIILIILLGEKGNAERAIGQCFLLKAKFIFSSLFFYKNKFYNNIEPEDCSI